MVDKRKVNALYLTRSNAWLSEMEMILHIPYAVYYMQHIICNIKMHKNLHDVISTNGFVKISHKSFVRSLLIIIPAQSGG